MARRNRENRENSPDKELIEQHVPTVSQAVVRASGVLMGADRAAQEYAEHVIRAEVEAYCDGPPTATPYAPSLSAPNPRVPRLPW